MYDRRFDGFNPNTVNKGDCSGERELERQFIKQFYSWVETKADELADFNDRWGCTVNQEQALTKLGRDVIITLGNMPIAANGIIFKVIRYENGRVYEFKFEITAIKRGGIRRSTDDLSIKFLEVPGYGKNPVVEHARCSTEESVFTFRKFTIVMPHEIIWNM